PPPASPGRPWSSGSAASGPAPAVWGRCRCSRPTSTLATKRTLGAARASPGPRARTAPRRRSGLGRLPDLGVEVDGPLPEPPDAGQLGVDVLEPVLAGRLVGLDRLGGGVERLAGRAMKLLGACGEEVAQLALDPTERVLGVLGDHERLLVGVLAVGLLGLAAALVQRPPLLARPRLA